MGCFAEEAEDAGGGLRPPFPHRHHQSCWDEINGLYGAFMSEYV